MKTLDLFKVDRSARKINEGIEKVFGKKINFEKFDLPQLEDARNKLRTQLSQIRSDSGFNENLDNETFHQAKWMLDAINAKIAERQEFIVDPNIAEINTDEGFGSLEDQAAKIISQFDQKMNEIGGYGDPDYKAAISALQQGDVDSAIAAVVDTYGNKDGGEVRGMDAYIEDLEADFEAIAAGGNETQNNQGEEMHKVTEGEVQQASAIVTAKTMADRVGRWIEELSGMENDTLLNLGDSIRDEMGQEQAKNFISTVAPAIQAALEHLKTTRETIATGVRTLTGEEQPAEMLGAEPAGGEEETDMAAPAEPDAMNVEPEAGAEDEFAAAEPAAGGAEEAGREQRESIQYQNRLLKVLAG